MDVDDRYIPLKAFQFALALHLLKNGMFFHFQLFQLGFVTRPRPWDPGHGLRFWSCEMDQTGPGGVSGRDPLFLTKRHRLCSVVLRSTSSSWSLGSKPVSKHQALSGWRKQPYWWRHRWSESWMIWMENANGKHTSKYPMWGKARKLKQVGLLCAFSVFSVDPLSRQLPRGDIYVNTSPRRNELPRTPNWSSARRIRAIWAKNCFGMGILWTKLFLEACQGSFMNFCPESFRLERWTLFARSTSFIFAD